MMERLSTGFPSAYPLGAYQQVLETLKSLAVDKVRPLFNPDNLRRIVFTDIVALLVVLTACSDSQDKPNGVTAAAAGNRRKELKTDGLAKDKKCFMDREFYGRHKSLSDLFAKCVSTQTNVQSKSNFGRPMFRLIEDTELIGKAGDLQSGYLWKLTDSIATEVPNKYSSCWDSALLYLVLSDAGTSFANFVAARAECKAVEIPCLLEMFSHSESNNRNNLSALLSEYLALIRICFFERYIGEEFTCECVTVGHDFCLKKHRKEIGHFSVKRISHDTKYFGDLPDEDSLKCIDNFVYESGEANIFLHRCSCESCIADPVRKVVVNEDWDVEELSAVTCNSKDLFTEILVSIQGEISRRKHTADASVVIYLVSAPLSNDIRFALGTDEKFSRRRFPLRDFLVHSLSDKFRDSNGKLPSDFGVLTAIPTLLDRS